MLIDKCCGQDDQGKARKRVQNLHTALHYIQVDGRGVTSGSFVRYDRYIAERFSLLGALVFYNISPLFFIDELKDGFLFVSTSAILRTNEEIWLFSPERLNASAKNKTPNFLYTFSLSLFLQALNVK